ncbi:uncharacterized protein TEOVI_000767600 [Trypanosoma equiperdum]|uniref:Uncharacterized protein n=3 Tax=Trypanozoon TaxID=39700 RepID=C9ZY23_TRYB9|nr:hypothetical protein, conserved [Trypanosoma brucei gambiense DAL972]RHW70374.1 hypothetical protein DPX39_090037500 [Trypanosoma brucei equiperdum]CBH14318.1 hypothetical protein, conserved [Trypanosoma brucei gambiense DAL972]SCU64973.1 hypothetical protein, conserved [Trypanosoma equiperdum]|eukprot:XP_011776588.1 hypothetical protein, conserved [Trypanosoma brucei gambiense DAL972]
MKNKAASRRDEKLIKGTNIIVKNVSLIDKHRNDPQALLHSIEADDAVELRWWRNALRPEANLIEPAVAYLQGIKVIRPATNFNTFDIKKARLRRLEKQEIERKKCLERRKRDVAPTAAMKASANPYRVPRSGGYIKQKDDRIIQRGEKTKKAAKKDIKESGGKTQRHKSNDEKGKLQKIGKGL